MTRYSILTLSVLMSWALHPATAADDWPNWRGPSGNGTSSETDLPVSWSDEENVRFRVALGGVGLSTPVVADHRIFVTSQIGRGVVRSGNHPTLGGGDGAAPEKSISGAEDADVIFLIEAFSHRDGASLWSHRIEAAPADAAFPEVHRKTNLANPSPVTDGERVYAWFGTGQIAALTVEGEVQWSKHLGRDYGRYEITWGHSSSPTLYEDLLILLCDHEGASYLLALDKRTGEERWRADRGAGLRSYSTPTIVPGPDGDELIVNSSAAIEGYDPRTGERLWFYEESNRFPIPVPSFSDGVIYTSRGYRSGPYMALRPGGRGDIAGTDRVVWKVATGAPYVSSVVHYGGVVYLASDAGVLQAADAATGERLFQLRTGGVFSAAPIAGDGKIYFVSETGETIVLRAGREPAILARNAISDRILASPIASGGLLFLRTDGELIAIGGD